MARADILKPLAALLVASLLSSASAFGYGYRKFPTTANVSGGGSSNSANEAATGGTSDTVLGTAFAFSGSTPTFHSPSQASLTLSGADHQVEGPSAGGGAMGFSKVCNPSPPPTHNDMHASTKTRAPEHAPTNIRATTH